MANVSDIIYDILSSSNGDEEEAAIRVSARLGVSLSVAKEHVKLCIVTKEVTTLQRATLKILSCAGVSGMKGVNVREYLRVKGYNQTPSSFCLLMGRMEDKGLVLSKFQKIQLRG